MAFIRNWGQIFELGLTEESETKLEEFFREIAGVELRTSKFVSLPENQRMTVFFVLATLEKIAPELESLTLNRIFERGLPEMDRSSAIFFALTNCKIMQLKRKVDTSEIERVRALFDTCRLLHLGLVRIADNFFVHPEDIRQIWSLLLFITATKLEQNDFPEVIEFMGTLLVLFLQKKKSDISVDSFLSRFFDHYKYNIDKADIERKTALVKQAVPDILEPEFQVEKYQKKYIDSLGKRSINFLCFLYSVRSTMNSPNITTPVRNLHNSSTHVHPARPFEFRPNKTLKPACFAPSTNQPSSPDRILRSPVIKKEIESLKHTQNHCEMIEWFRREVRNVSLSSINVSGTQVQISSFFQNYIEVDFVRQSLPKIAALCKNVPPPDEVLFLQFFFQVLESLVKNELVDEAKRQSAERVFKDSSFVVSLFALCYELRMFIKNPARNVKLSEVVTLFDCKSVFDIYKVLLNFINTCYKRLPVLLQAHLHRVEIDILLKELWTKPMAGQDFGPKRIFFSRDELYSTIQAKINQIMNERLCLIAGAMGLLEEEKAHIWATFELLLATGLDGNSKEEDYSFKFDIHLDVLLIATILECRTAAKGYCALKQILDPYDQLVLFPHENMRACIMDFCKKNKEILSMCIKRVHFPTEEVKTNPNSTPIRASQPRERQGPFLSDLVLSQITKRSYRDFSSGISTQSDNSLLITPEPRVRTPMRLFDLGADLHRPNPIISEPQNQNQNLNIVMPDLAEPSEPLMEPCDGLQTPQF